MLAFVRSDLYFFVWTAIIWNTYDLLILHIWQIFSKVVDLQHNQYFKEFQKSLAKEALGETLFNPNLGGLFRGSF